MEAFIIQCLMLVIGGFMAGFGGCWGWRVAEAIHDKLI